MKKRNSTLFKSALLGVMAIATSLSVGLSACSKRNEEDDKDDTGVSKVDTQELKNGNFEFYSDNKGVYPISSPNDWTGSTNGNSSASKSGIIDTRKDRWDYITDKTFPDTLEANNDKSSDDETKKDYNGVMPDDLPYKNPHTALDSSSADSDSDEDPKAYINNPFTHEYRYDENGKYYDKDGEIAVYANEDEYGKLYLDEKYEEPLETSVLMIHNYRSGYFTGTETYFKSGTTLTLEANTACEISVWVKTCDLTFDGATSSRTEVKFERGAYIKVETQVGGNSLGSFIIRNINTEILNPDNENNGWVQYTVYVEASTFADTKVNLTLGLGESSTYTVEGYAFFDDITYTKYLNAKEMAESNEGKNDYNKNFYEKDLDAINDPVCYPLEPDADTEFRVDVETYYVKNDGEDADENKVKQETKYNYSEFNAFLIDCASTTSGSADDGDELKLKFDDTIQVGHTIDETSTGKFATSAKKPYTNGIEWVDYGEGENKTNIPEGTHIPIKLGSDGIDISDDILLTTTITENWTFNFNNTVYGNKLTEALKTAIDLPGAGSETSAFVMLSALGAPYEAKITNDLFTLGDGEYLLISFWIKTEDMKGKTGATITAVELDEDGKETSNSSYFTIDSTTEATTKIGDAENVYNDWVRCFIRVSNTSKATKTFIIKVNFGEKSIKGTDKNSFTAGWLALVNPSIMALDKDVYGYSSSVSHSATLSFTEDPNNTTHNFDSADDSKLKADIANPNSYTGVNGASIHISADADKENEDYNKTNSNTNAGLINKNYFVDGKYGDYDHYLHDETGNNKDWYNALIAITARNHSDSNLDEMKASDIWNLIFDEYTVQPLLIVNTVRKINDVQEIYNYGFVGNSSSISSNGYVAVSVRVKASMGAIANVYLVEDKSSRAEVLAYSVPKFNFWYDSDGNILKGKPDENATKEEKKENIAYTIREDGLYENGDGKLYANFYNLEKYYDITFEHENFYDENGNLVAFEKLETGKTYYANANGDKKKYAPHYLIAGGNANSKVYLYNDGVGDDVSYYYMENSEANKSKVVYGIDTSVAKLRYEKDTAPTPYQFTIDTNTNPEYADKWITVTFFIHAGSKTKNYRLELWSGSRDEEVSYDKSKLEGNYHSYVVFDYSSISLNQSTFEGLRDSYVNEIVADYRKIISDKLDNNDANISELEALAGENNKSKLFNYEAKYYTFSLYDSPAFIPFNGETASADQSGYSYDYTNYEEQLTYLKVVDDGRGKLSEEESDSYSMSLFIDFSALDMDIDIIGVPTVSEGNNDTDKDTDSNTNFWLLFASIALVVVIIVAMLAIFIRDFAKKHVRKKTAGKNSYNFNKNKRYVRKYIKANGEAPTIVEDDVDESILSDNPTEVDNDEIAEAASEVESEDTAPTDNEGSTSSADGEQAESSDANDEAKGENAEDGENPDKAK